MITCSSRAASRRISSSTPARARDQTRVGPVPAAESRGVTPILADVGGLGAALIGVGGTVIGVTAGIVGQLVIERTRTTREDQRLSQEGERAVRASARLMLQDLHRAKARLDELLTGEWWPVEQELEFLVALEDRRRLAARLDPGEFTLLVRAEVEFSNWQQQRVRQPGRPTQIDKAALDVSMQLLEDAMTALLALSEVNLGPYKPSSTIAMRSSSSGSGP